MYNNDKCDQLQNLQLNAAIDEDRLQELSFLLFKPKMLPYLITTFRKPNPS